MTIHENGVKRHGFLYYSATQAAVTAITYSNKLKPWNPDVKVILPLVVLRVLDHIKISQGLTWNKEKECWEEDAGL